VYVVPGPTAARPWRARPAQTPCDSTPRPLARARRWCAAAHTARTPQPRSTTNQADGQEEMRASCSERVILDLGILGYRPQKDRVSHPERTRAGFGA